MMKQWIDYPPKNGPAINNTSSPLESNNSNKKAKINQHLRYFRIGLQQLAKEKIIINIEIKTGSLDGICT